MSIQDGRFTRWNLPHPFCLRLYSVCLGLVFVFPQLPRLFKCSARFSKIRMMSRGNHCLSNLTLRKYGGYFPLSFADLDLFFFDRIVVRVIICKCILCHIDLGATCYPIIFGIILVAGLVPRCWYFAINGVSDFFFSQPTAGLCN